MLQKKLAPYLGKCGSIVDPHVLLRLLILLLFPAWPLEHILAQQGTGQGGSSAVFPILPSLYTPTTEPAQQKPPLEVFQGHNSAGQRGILAPLPIYENNSSPQHYKDCKDCEDWQGWDKSQLFPGSANCQPGSENGDAPWPTGQEKIDRNGINGQNAEAPGLPITNGEDDNGGPSAHLTGQVQVDFVTFNQSEANRLAVGDLQNAVGFRRARLGIFGELFETTEYRIEFDFALSGRPRFLDNWIAVKELGIPVANNVIVGHYFEPFSLERYTPNRFITFVERSAVDVFAPARNTGVMMFDHAETERLTWAAGAFRTSTNEFGDIVGDSRDWAATAHVTWLAWYDEPSDGRYLMHLGASYSHRFVGDKVVQFRKRPSSQLQAFNEAELPFFVDTGLIPSDRYQLVGLEAAWVQGPFSIQSEIVIVPVRHTAGPDPTFWAAYAYASYFLTGEHRSYSPTGILGRFREGIFQRITPRTNAFRGLTGGGNPRGPGAWELAARWEYIRLDSSGIDGGRMHILTAGVNWYLNPNTRLQVNYMRPLLHTANVGASTADSVIVRLGFEF